jgi:hypothetical protein
VGGRQLIGIENLPICREPALEFASVPGSHTFLKSENQQSCKEKKHRSAHYNYKTFSSHIHFIGQRIYLAQGFFSGL